MKTLTLTLSLLTSLSLYAACEDKQIQVIQVWPEQTEDLVVTGMVPIQYEIVNPLEVNIDEFTFTLYDQFETGVVVEQSITQPSSLITARWNTTMVPDAYYLPVAKARVGECLFRSAKIWYWVNNLGEKNASRLLILR